MGRNRLIKVALLVYVKLLPLVSLSRNLRPGKGKAIALLSVEVISPPLGKRLTEYNSGTVSNNSSAAIHLMQACNNTSKSKCLQGEPSDISRWHQNNWNGKLLVVRHSYKSFYDSVSQRKGDNTFKSQCVQDPSRAWRQHQSRTGMEVVDLKG
ncbi:hypothetical protein RRG08_017660 [Elysia crispata]|uniref:Uncharacterized protein n=1 Tax=Elysia crispata TaxID=231223 RepID=A0AAE0ZB56_9GAST|nr:hypothetical protein RRG08_017660 [Elysia crispata]